MSMVRLAHPASARRRRPGLTPMIDVVFLLLIFFMVAARFGTEQAAPLAAGGGEAGAARWEGPPRLVTVTPGGVLLNGRPVPREALTAALEPLMPGPGAPVVLRPAGAATVADLARVVEALRAAGITNLVLVP